MILLPLSVLERMTSLGKLSGEPVAQDPPKYVTFTTAIGLTNVS